MSDPDDLFSKILSSRNLTDPELQAVFLSPDYGATRHDPFLLPDMRAAVNRIKLAKKLSQRVVIYGDYDIDGLTATALLLDAFSSLGIKADAFIPNRFVEGYGLNAHAIRSLAEAKADLIITVDCGSLSHVEIELANHLHVDVIVTDHHTVSEAMPPAVAVINPKRPGHSYPFIDLAGVGVALKLVQALQTELGGLPEGQEKWLLDLVAFGTVCDVVNLIDENRSNVYFGLKVMEKSRRPGLKALMAVASVIAEKVNARALAFGLGPRLNAAGRLETARLGLELLMTTDRLQALKLAEKLDELNQARRLEQDRIYKAALDQAVMMYPADPVLVLSHPEWSHGIIGIVAAKLLEKLKKPTFVLQELGEESKGSARSFGDFSVVEAINSAKEHIIKGGGHTFAAGVTLQTNKISDFRRSINDFYVKQKLKSQIHYLEPKADVIVELIKGFNEKLLEQISRLEPYGHGNPPPVFKLTNMAVSLRREMGAQHQHLKLELTDPGGHKFTVVAFNKATEIKADVGDVIDVWVELILNEWQNNRTVEGRLLRATLK